MLVFYTPLCTRASRQEDWVTRGGVTQASPQSGDEGRLMHAEPPFRVGRAKGEERACRKARGGSKTLRGRGKGAYSRSARGRAVSSLIFPSMHHVVLSVSSPWFIASASSPSALFRLFPQRRDHKDAFCISPAFPTRLFVLHVDVSSPVI